MVHITSMTVWCEQIKGKLTEQRTDRAKVRRSRTKQSRAERESMTEQNRAEQQSRG